MLKNTRRLSQLNEFADTEYTTLPVSCWHFYSLCGNVLCGNWPVTSTTSVQLVCLRRAEPSRAEPCRAVPCRAGPVPCRALCTPPPRPVASDRRCSGAACRPQCLPSRQQWTSRDDVILSCLTRITPPPFPGPPPLSPGPPRPPVHCCPSISPVSPVSSPASAAIASSWDCHFAMRAIPPRPHSF